MTTNTNTQSTSTRSSNGSFVDASTEQLLEPPHTNNIDINSAELEQREPPLSTPTKEKKTPLLQPVTDDQLQHKSSVTTIFDVATEIETMLQEITTRFEEQDTLLSDKVDSIYKKLDKLESRVKR